MLTPEKLHALDDKARLAAFDELAVAVYGADKIAEQIARDMDVTRATYFGWRNNPHRIPAAVVLLLQEWAVSRNAKAVMLRNWDQVAHGLAAVAVSLEEIARLSRVREAESETQLVPASEQSSTASAVA